MVFVVETIGRIRSAREGALKLGGGGDRGEGVYTAHTEIEG